MFKKYNFDSQFTDGPVLRSGGFTLIELLVTLSIIGLLLALLLPAVQSARESARRGQCASNLHQLALAINGYASAYNVFPPGATLGGYSLITQILLYADHHVLYNNINLQINVNSCCSYGQPNTTSFFIQMSMLLCPSSPAPNDGSGAVTSYAGNGGYGNQAFGFNGLFINGSVRPRPIGFAAVEDGTSQTSLMSEWIVGSRLAPDRNPAVAAYYTEELQQPNEFNEFVDICRDVNPLTTSNYSCKMCSWMNGDYSLSLLNHVLPPRGHSCFNGGSADFGSWAANSRHPSGVNMLLTDGHVAFIRSNIGLVVWRALSTRAGHEIVSDGDF